MGASCKLGLTTSNSRLSTRGSCRAGNRTDRRRSLLKPQRKNATVRLSRHEQGYWSVGTPSFTPKWRGDPFRLAETTPIFRQKAHPPDIPRRRHVFFDETRPAQLRVQMQTRLFRGCVFKLVRARLVETH